MMSNVSDTGAWISPSTICPITYKQSSTHTVQLTATDLDIALRLGGELTLVCTELSFNEIRADGLVFERPLRAGLKAKTGKFVAKSCRTSASQGATWQYCLSARSCTRLTRRQTSPSIPGCTIRLVDMRSPTIDRESYPKALNLHRSHEATSTQASNLFSIHGSNYADAWRRCAWDCTCNRGGSPNEVRRGAP